MNNAANTPLHSAAADVAIYREQLRDLSRRQREAEAAGDDDLADDLDQEIVETQHALRAALALTE